MQAELHPEMNVVKVHCACGNEFETLSTAPELRLEICGACHPFYTGRQKFVDTAGRIQRFQEKYAWNAEAAKKKSTEKGAPKRPKVAPPREDDE